MTFTYRKKPIVVEAWQFTPENLAILNSDHTSAFPSFLLTQVGLDNIRIIADGSIHVVTDTGAVMPIPEGYWIISGVNGEVYGCAPDVFAVTYDPVNPVEDTWQGRLIIEGDELNQKIIKLANALEAGSVPSDQVQVLTDQLESMNAYYAILAKRINAIT